MLWEKDTALAWFMPTKTATQRITLDHSLLSLCGSPRRWSIQGYSKPINAEKTRVAFNRHHRSHRPTYLKNDNSIHLCENPLLWQKQFRQTVYNRNMLCVFVYLQLFHSRVEPTRRMRKCCWWRLEGREWRYAAPVAGLARVLETLPP